MYARSMMISSSHSSSPAFLAWSRSSSTARASGLRVNDALCAAVVSPGVSLNTERDSPEFGADVDGCG
jgi:hypothetical protein